LILLTGVAFSAKFLHFFQEYVSATNKREMTNFFEEDETDKTSKHKTNRLRSTPSITEVTQSDVHKPDQPLENEIHEFISEFD
jgi:hypothetical protein